LSLGFIIVLQKEISGVEPRSFDGRMLARKRHTLDSIAHEQDLRGLGEFVAFSHVEAEALAEDMKFDAPTVGGQTGRWFRPADGLEVVRGIRDYLSSSPDDIDELHELDEVMEIIAALGSMEAILEAAEERGVKFRLSLDY
jgi:hypothetical protein